MHGHPTSSPPRAVVAPGANNANQLNATCCDVDEGTALRLLREPARSLTLDEACYVLVYLARRGAITLLRPNGPRTGPGFTRDCGAITYPAPPPYDPRHPTTTPTHVTVGPTIDGVTFHYGAQEVRLRNYDVRLVVFIYKLARHMRERWGADRIDHAGGIDGRERSAHREGRALDISGVRGTRGGARYANIVSHHWGEHPIPADLLEPIPAGRHVDYQGAGATVRIFRGPRPAYRWPVWTNGDWVNVVVPQDVIPAERGAWGPARLANHESAELAATHRPLHRFAGHRFRLSAGDTSFRQHRRLPPPHEPRAMFLDIYDFCTRECSDRENALYHPRPNEPDHRHAEALRLEHEHVHDIHDPAQDSATSGAAQGSATSGPAELPTSLEHLDDPQRRSQLILHPDYRSANPWYCQSHDNHFHVQIGPTQRSASHAFHRSLGPVGPLRPCQTPAAPPPPTPAPGGGTS